MPPCFLGVNFDMTQIQESRVEDGKVQRLIAIQYKYTYLYIDSYATGKFVHEMV